MTDDLVAWVESLLSTWAFYPVLAGLAAVDSLFPLIPSEAVITLAGAWAGSQGVPNVWRLFLAAALGAVIGDNLCYLLGTRLIGVVERVPPDSARGRAVAWARHSIRRRAGTTLIIARFIPWARWFLTIMLGSVRYPWRQFLLYDTIGVTIWAAQATLLGYLGGWFFQGNPLAGMIAGITIGTLAGLLVQKLQDRAFRRRDRREQRERA